MKIVLVLIQVIFRPSLSNIYQVIRYLFAVNHVVGQVFARTDIHITVHLSRVGTDNFAPYPIGQSCSKRCFSTGCGTQNSNHFLHISKSRQFIIKTKRCAILLYRAPSISRLNIPITYMVLLQFCEVLNCTNHLRSIRVLIVVPRYHLNLISIVVNLAYHCLSSVKE